MEKNQAKRRGFQLFCTLVWSLLLGTVFVSAEKKSIVTGNTWYNVSDFITDFSDKGVQAKKSAYHQVWPDLKFSWQLIAGSVAAVLGAAFGGGGGVFVPMLILIVGFDPKSAIAISNCMIGGAAVSTVYYNLKHRHRTVDYDLALLIQPMLLLGISIGVILNMIFADWMIYILLMIILLGTSIRAGLRGVETWMKESLLRQEAANESMTRGNSNNGLAEYEVGFSENVRWKELGLLVMVWIAFLALQILKNYTTACSTTYWLVNLLQIPVSFMSPGLEVISLYNGRRGDVGVELKVKEMIVCCLAGVVAGTVGGLLGLGGVFIIAPLLFELGVPLQVSSATSNFAMIFSSSLSIVEYYLLKRFPIPQALYFAALATVAALIGQHFVRSLVAVTTRASYTICILAFTLFVGALSLGGVGTSNMIEKIQRNEYMGFQYLCKN